MKSLNFSLDFIALKVKVLAALLVCLFSIPVMAPAVAAADAPLTLEPTQGTIGSSIKIPSFCQYGNGDYTLYWGDNNQVIVQGTIEAGTCQPIYFKIPQAPRGSHMVTLQVANKSFQREFFVLPSISLESATGASGSRVNVQGNGFASGEDTIKLTFDGIGITTGITANSNGNWLYELEIPDCNKGLHQLSASGSTTQPKEIGALNFNVTPSIRINPSTGWVGKVISVSGAGFSSTENDIEVIYDNSVVKSGISADLNGSWQTSFSIPPSSKGPHRITAMSSKTGVDEVPDISFMVSPGIKLEQTSGRLGETIKAGDRLYINGIGFQKNETKIAVTWDGSTVAENIIADASGSWASQFTVPGSTGGDHLVTASGSVTRAGDVSACIVIITSEIDINPQTGAVGENTLLSGSGFGANLPITIYFDSKKIDSGCTSDARGSFSISFQPPSSQAGEHIIRVNDTVNNFAMTTFAIESLPPAVPVLVSPEEGAKINTRDDEPVIFKWNPVEDPSGVSYTLEISRKTDFSGDIVRREALAKPEYELSESEKQPAGTRYWRVRAVDGAGNISDWSELRKFTLSGFNFFLPMLIILAILLVIGLIVWRIRVITRD